MIEKRPTHTSLSILGLCALLYLSPSLVAQEAPGRILGDANCDGQINRYDVEPFAMAVVQAWNSKAGGCDPRGSCDMDRNGTLDLLDLELFVDLLPGEGRCSNIRMGPIPNLTLRSTRSPLLTAIPIGRKVTFEAIGDGGAARSYESIRWDGAKPTTDYGDTAVATFDALGLHRIQAWGVSQDGLESPIGTSLFVVDASSPVGIRFQITGVDVAPFTLDEVATNEETMEHFFSKESPAALHSFHPNYATSVNRTVEIHTRSVPPGFSQFAEMNIDNLPHAQGQRMKFSSSRMGSFVIDSGSIHHQDEIFLTTYRTHLFAVPDIRPLPEGVPLTFVVLTEPPGFEDAVVFISSTKFGTAEPTLGRGPVFSMQFDDVWGPDGTKWLGVRANDARIDQDDKNVLIQLLSRADLLSQITSAILERLRDLPGMTPEDIARLDDALQELGIAQSLVNAAIASQVGLTPQQIAAIRSAIDVLIPVIQGWLDQWQDANEVLDKKINLFPGEIIGCFIEYLGGVVDSVGDEFLAAGIAIENEVPVVGPVVGQAVQVAGTAIAVAGAAIEFLGSFLPF